MTHGTNKLESYQGSVNWEHAVPVGFAALSFVSTLTLLHVLTSGTGTGSKGDKYKSQLSRSTYLPGYGILGDRINELIEIFLDALAIYVHNDRKWDCPRRLLCEANQRAADYGLVHGIVMYCTSLAVSFLLKGHRVSESMAAMRKGRHGLDCTMSYPHCPFSL